jgi:hypothetical protein
VPAVLDGGMVSGCVRDGETLGWLSKIQFAVSHADLGGATRAGACRLGQRDNSSRTGHIQGASKLNITWRKLDVRRDVGGGRLR